MKEKSKNEYTPEFMAKVALEAAKELLTLDELSIKYKLSTNQIQVWKNELITYMPVIFKKTFDRSFMGYFRNLLISIDQLGNTICGGDPDSTISARVGYFALRSSGSQVYFWKGLQKVINFTFWPVDGHDHCLKAFHNDPLETFYDNRGDFFRIGLSVIVVPLCVLISTILYLIWLVRKLFLSQN
ncbi:MAG: hypothetical protein H6605_05010 [Flavobacteriales bacterium]|nr:hypothetical protein [Flavobacteriales bacterium]